VTFEHQAIVSELGSRGPFGTFEHQAIVSELGSRGPFGTFEHQAIVSELGSRGPFGHYSLVLKSHLSTSVPHGTTPN
jgi:hypothetical protein